MAAPWRYINERGHDVSSLGHTYDFDSYRLVANAITYGKNVYAWTPRYNYGPVWFNLLQS